MSILEFLVDSVVNGIHWLSEAFGWLSVVIYILTDLVTSWYPFNLIFVAGASVLTIKMILRGGK